MGFIVGRARKFDSGATRAGYPKAADRLWLWRSFRFRSRIRRGQGAPRRRRARPARPSRRRRPRRRPAPLRWLRRRRHHNARRDRWASLSAGRGNSIPGPRGRGIRRQPIACRFGACSGLEAGCAAAGCRGEGGIHRQGSRAAGDTVKFHGLEAIHRRQSARNSNPRHRLR